MFKIRSFRFFAYCLFAYRVTQGNTEGTDVRSINKPRPWTGTPHPLFLEYLALKDKVKSLKGLIFINLFTNGLISYLNEFLDAIDTDNLIKTSEKFKLYSVKKKVCHSYDWIKITNKHIIKGFHRFTNVVFID